MTSTGTATNSHAWASPTFGTANGILTLPRGRGGRFTIHDCEQGLIAWIKHLLHWNVLFKAELFGKVYVSQREAHRIILASKLSEETSLRTFSLKKLEATFASAVQLAPLQDLGEALRSELAALQVDLRQLQEQTGTTTSCGSEPERELADSTASVEEQINQLNEINSRIEEKIKDVQLRIQRLKQQASRG